MPSIISASLSTVSRKLSCLNNILNFQCQKIVFECIRDDAMKTFDESESRTGLKTLLKETFFLFDRCITFQESRNQSCQKRDNRKNKIVGKYVFFKKKK